mmetsp:Transcript_5289/g.15055  ORF Transcript_5289/g.15055 Transcript_5289/m.15055 type:complete len:208 (-) Transcript_5289:164-787(-)
MVRLTRSLLHALCATWLALPSQALFFELKPGALSECFKVKAEASEWIVGSYEADGPTEGVKVVLYDLNERELWKSEESSSKFSLQQKEAGKYKICFDTTISEVQMVSFSLLVDDHDHHSPGHVSKDMVTQDHTNKVKNLVAKLEAQTSDILDQQQYTITREAVHRNTAESTNSRVMWWTILEVVLLICLAGFQVYYLRSYFEVKQII